MTDSALTPSAGRLELVTHVVIFNWVAGTTAQQISALGEALDRMADDVGDFASIRHGPDLGFRETNGDYALIATFPDKAAWAAYQAHPQHKAFVASVVTPLQASRTAIQI